MAKQAHSTTLSRSDETASRKASRTSRAASERTQLRQKALTQLLESLKASPKLRKRALASLTAKKQSLMSSGFIYDPDVKGDVILDAIRLLPPVANPQSPARKASTKSSRAL